MSEPGSSCGARTLGPPADVTSCVTCSDAGIHMRVVRIDVRRDLALCEDERGRRSTVEIALIAGVACGDTLLVHAGTALVRA